VREWSEQHPWQLTLLIWISGVILVLFIQLLLSHLNGRSIDWAEAFGLALIIPSVGSVGLISGVHQRRRRAGMDRTP
jgi:predicted permease